MKNLLKTLFFLSAFLLQVLFSNSFNNFIINISYQGKDTIAIINKSKSILKFITISKDTSCQIAKFDLYPLTNLDNKNLATDEGTPEGIYFFKEQIKIKSMTHSKPIALMLNYPNYSDQFNNRTGSNVWLQEPTNKERNNKSCFYLKNATIKQVIPYIQQNKTPVIILKNKDIHSNLMTGEGWQQFMNRWKKSFASKRLIAHWKLYIVDSDKQKFKYAEKINMAISSDSSYTFNIENLMVLQTPQESAIAFQLNFNSDTYQLEKHFSMSLLPVDGQWKIFSENGQYRPPLQLSPDKKIEKLIFSWKNAWEQLNFSDFIAFYSKSYHGDSRDFNAYYKYKEKTFQNLSKIKVNLNNIKIEKKDSHYIVTFDQDYWTPSYKDYGKKTLIFQKEEEKYKIISENWRPLD